MATILIVDDEKNIRESIKGILEDEGYKTITAENGVKGINICKSKNIDVALVDVWLPNVNGIEVTKKIKEISNSTEIIVITGHGNIDTAVKALKAGAYDFFDKPISLDKLIISVKKAIEHKSLIWNLNFGLKNYLDKYSIPQIPEYKHINSFISNLENNISNSLITGEFGTGKRSFIFYIYLKYRDISAQTILLNFKEMNAPIYYRNKIIFGYNFIPDNNNLEYIKTSIKNKCKFIIAVINDENLDKFYKNNFIIIKMPDFIKSKNIFKYYLNFYNIFYSNVFNMPKKEFSDETILKLFNKKWKFNIRELKNFIEQMYLFSE